MLSNCEWNQKQKHKKQPWSNVECFTFGGATVRFASLETSFHAANHTIPPPPSHEGSPHCPKDKNRSPFHGEKKLMVIWFLGRRLCQISQNDNAIAQGHAFGMLGDALIIFCLHRNMPKACPYVLIRKFSPRASQFQIIDNQYSIKIVGGRELSRPYRVWFFAEGERFLSFWRCHRPRKRAVLGVWCG